MPRLNHVEWEGSGTPDDLSNQAQGVRLDHKLADKFDANRDDDSESSSRLQPPAQPRGRHPGSGGNHARR